MCKRPDKSMLNNNLVNSFHSEFIREVGRNDSDQAVIAWKFQSLDSNRDGVLDKDEYRDLRKIVKKAAKPKRCARQFPRSCDVDRDGVVGEREWEDCLTRDGMDVSLRVFLSLTADGRGGGGGGNGPGILDQSAAGGGDTGEMDMDTSEDEYPEQLFRGHRAPPDGVLTEISQPGSQEDESSEITDDPPDCLSDRKTALAEGLMQLYVPECTPDGRYQKIQCYKSAGYCWCVNEDTGRNIAGTSVKNGLPNCNQLKTSNRPMKGCPDDKKIIFLKELLQFLHTKMSEIVNSTTSFNNLAWIGSKEEQAATWSFVVFDKNKNKMLERSEWKSFKDMVGTVKSLRKCGKKLPRYCDSNKDRQISMTEWLECLNVQQGVISVTSPPSSRAGKKNPLSILKDD
ncbi:unnamed protein product [Acanthoscelides obtectus]|uniref:Uncharacterized protein n=1 Tax=Acanthoscelides obtectus TaxID=200917 RepID=A0A9P0JW37_ACAOB|nr:unnamed protein product [Acanthoscelides obtectus]CAK1657084.1 SPARC-related modular calcium-binding protein 1 [Acanthoscelides obtectus]